MYNFTIDKVFRLLSLRTSIIRHLSTMTDKPLIQSSDSWFNKYEENCNVPEGILKGVSDRFQGITVDSKEEACNASKFTDALNNSLDYWTKQKRRGIWFKVRLENAEWVPILANNKFQFHHAKDDFVMMYRWLPENEMVNIPPYSHTMVGVGAVVINDDKQVLVVSEKNSLIKKSWKLPGGYVEPCENFVDAAIREVLEETNVRTKFESLVSIRHAHKAGFGCSDLYFVLALTPQSTEIVKCDREISKCEWMNIEEYLNHPNVHETNRDFVRTYLMYKEKGIVFGCYEDIHQILKKKYNIYKVALHES